MQKRSTANAEYKVGIYCRLSQEDGNDTSQSIKAQREIISEYVTLNNWVIEEIYTDDGYTGTSFNRPGFKRLINDIELGRINMVVTKDLSRLGRNYIQTGYYTEEFFPEHNVRYIAINDSFDSIDEDSGDFMPLKNLMNEWYAKDISKKIRFTLEGKAKNGEPRNTVFPIFGYTYNERFERIPDPETADIVRLVYKKYTEFASSARVAKYLREKGIYIPRFYNAVKYGYNKAKILTLPKETYTAWTPSMVRDIISKDAYLGTYKTAQTKSISFKNKKRRKNEKCYVFNHRYEPLVDEGTWTLANSIMKKVGAGTVGVEDNTFKGVLFCGDCRRPMRFERRRNAKNNTFEFRYFCNNKTCGRCNSISRRMLSNVIELEISDLMQFVMPKEDCFYNESNSVDTMAENMKIAEKRIIKSIDRIDMKTEFVLNQLADGLIANSTFFVLVENYKKEKAVLESELLRLKEKAEASCSEGKKDFESIISTVAKIRPCKLLCYKFLQKFISKIYINAESVDGKKQKRRFNLCVEYNIKREILLQRRKNA